MRITLCSIFRDSTTYLDRYLSQVGGLRELYQVRQVFGEGDHRDHTATMLRMKAPADTVVVEVNHGGPRFGSIDQPARWDNIAKVVRRVLDVAIDDPGDALIWVEADLLWESATMQGLLDDLVEVPAVAPLTLIDQSDRAYDTWGVRQHGAGINPDPPYWHEPVLRQGPLVKVDSVGSCFVAGPDAYPWLETWTGHWPATCGGKLWLDPRLTIRHP